MKIFKDSFIYLCGELFAKALPFLLLPYLTRKLGVAGFGELSYYQTILSLLALFFGFSQDGALTRYFYFYGKRNLGNLMLAGYAYTTILATLSLLWAWWLQSVLLAAVICAAATQTALNSQLAWRQCQKQALAYTSIQISSGILISMFTVIILEMSHSAPVTMRFVALILGNAIVSIMAYKMMRQRHKPRITWHRLQRAGCYIIAFGAPLLLHHASNFAKGQLDRIIIYQYYTAEELGIYAASLQIASIFSILLMAINKATVPYYYQAIKQGSLHANTVRHLSLGSLLLVPLPAICAYALPDALYTWFLGAQYIGTQYYICLFLLGFGLTLPYYLLVNYLFYHGKNRHIAVISMLSAGIYVLAVVGMSQMGLHWIPYAIIIANLAILPLLWHAVGQVQAAKY